MINEINTWKKTDLLSIKEKCIVSQNPFPYKVLMKIKNAVKYSFVITF